MTSTKESSKRYGFIAETNLSLSLMNGLLATSAFRPDQLVFSDEHVTEIDYEELKKRGVNVVSYDQLLMNECAVVFLDILPDTLKFTLNRLRNPDRILNALMGKMSPLIVSLVAGISIQNLEGLLEPLICQPRVIRLLANTSCSVQQGCCAYAVGRHVLSEDCRFVKEKFSQIGICEKVLESKLDVLSGIAFSGQSFIFSAIEAIVDGGVKLGLHQNMALKFAVNTALGSACMLKMKRGPTPLHPAIPRMAECAMSPSTSAAMHFLEKQSIRDSLMSAVEVALLRTREDAQKEMCRPVDTFILAEESDVISEIIPCPFAKKSVNGNSTLPC